MDVLNNRVAVITGAAGGIGRAVALELAERGCDVGISDVDEEGLGETERLAARRGVDVHAQVVDVADREAVYDWADAVANYFGDVHLVVNNAGVSVSATVDDIGYDDFEWLMNINFWGVVYGTKAFLPHLRDADEGHVVNISSIFGIVASPTQSAYNAAKFAVKGFTESLRAELEIEGAPIQASTVHPGGVKTDIVRSSRIGDTGAMDRTPDEVIKEFEEELARLTPEEAGEIIVDGIQEGKRRILVGKDAMFMDLVQRLMPSSYTKPMAEVIRRRG